MSTYNGWTNYETWRVNLELFDCWSLGDVWGYEDQDPKTADPYELGQILREYAEERINEGASHESLAHSYAMAFLSDVNWYEIAEHMIEDEVRAQA